MANQVEYLFDSTDFWIGEVYSLQLSRRKFLSSSVGLILLVAGCSKPSIQITPISQCEPEYSDRSVRQDSTSILDLPCGPSHPSEGSFSLILNPGVLVRTPNINEGVTMPPNYSVQMRLKLLPPGNELSIESWLLEGQSRALDGWGITAHKVSLTQLHTFSTSWRDWIYESITVDGTTQKLVRSTPTPKI